MAERRMIARSVCTTDAFRLLDAGAKSLYFQLVLAGDDDGFVGSPIGVMRADGDRQEDLAALIEAGFVIRFPSGVVAITHWKVHNNVRQDRYKATIHQDEYAQVAERGGSYVLRDGLTTICQPSDNQLTTTCQPVDNQVTTTCQPSVNHLSTKPQPTVNQVTAQDRLGKVSIGKVSIGEDRTGQDSIGASLAPARDAADARAREDNGGVVLSDEERSQLVGKMGEAMTQAYIDHLAEYIARTGKRYPSHFRLICEWYAKDKRDGKLPVVEGADSFDTDELFEAAVRRQYGDAADQALGVYNG